METKCILPVKTPKLSTYHFEANACIVGCHNPTFENWIHNECINIAAYDSAWVHRVFETSQKAFFEGVDAALKLDGFSKLISLKIIGKVFWLAAKTDRKQLPKRAILISKRHLTPRVACVKIILLIAVRERVAKLVLV